MPIASWPPFTSLAWLLLTPGFRPLPLHPQASRRGWTRGPPAPCAASPSARAAAPRVAATSAPARSARSAWPTTGWPQTWPSAWASCRRELGVLAGVRGCPPLPAWSTAMHAAQVARQLPWPGVMSACSGSCTAAVLVRFWLPKVCQEQAPLLMILSPVHQAIPCCLAAMNDASALRPRADPPPTPPHPTAGATPRTSPPSWWMSGPARRRAQVRQSQPAVGACRWAEPAGLAARRGHSGQTQRRPAVMQPKELL